MRHYWFIIFLFVGCRGRNIASQTSANSDDSAYVIDDWESLLKARSKIAKAEDPVLELLNHLSQEYLLNYTLGYAPQGLQKGSWSYPRVVMGALDGSLILTFVGHKNFGEINHLEILRSTGHSFELYDLNLADATAELRANPNDCTVCHGADPVPIWGKYNEWPGFYGSHDDVMREGDPERERFLQDYLTATADNPRYKKLTRMPDSKISPYHSFDVIPFTLYRPNFRIGIGLSHQMGRRLASRIVRHPHFAKVKFSLLNDIFCKQNWNFSTYAKQLDLSSGDINFEDPFSNLKNFDAEHGFYDGQGDIVTLRLPFALAEEFANMKPKDPDVDLSWAELNKTGNKSSGLINAAKSKGYDFSSFLYLSWARELPAGLGKQKFCENIAKKI